MLTMYKYEWISNEILNIPEEYYVIIYGKVKAAHKPTIYLRFISIYVCINSSYYMCNICNES